MNWKREYVYQGVLVLGLLLFIVAAIWLYPVILNWMIDNNRAYFEENWREQEARATLNALCPYRNMRGVQCVFVVSITPTPLEAR